MTTVLQGAGGLSACPRCMMQIGGEHTAGCHEAVMQIMAKLRPADYSTRPADEQWQIDSILGILDWEGY